MKKFIFTTIIGLFLFVNSACGVVFNPTNGTGSITQAEINAAYGWTTDKGLSFTCHKIEHYSATIQFQDFMGNTVTKVIDVPITTYQTVKVKKVAAGYDFVGYGNPLKLSRIPLVGEDWAFYYADKLIVSKVLSVSATPGTIDYGVLGFNGVYGYRKFY